LHIGKSSGGWVFGLHVDPELGINDLSDWVALWSKPGSKIVDEFGREVPPEEMLEVITKREWRGHELQRRVPREFPWRVYPDPGGGTWDYMTGEFS
jgi:hypothetical protein